MKMEFIPGLDLLVGAAIPEGRGGYHGPVSPECWREHRAWLKELYGLLERFSGMCIAPDISSMDLSELWGLYRFLKRRAQEAAWAVQAISRS